jgi:hypothetical protein
MLICDQDRAQTSPLSGDEGWGNGDPKVTPTIPISLKLVILG